MWPTKQLRYALPSNLYCSSFESTRADNDGKKTEHCVEYISWLDEVKTEVLQWPHSPRTTLSTTPCTTLTIVVDLPDLNDSGALSRGRLKVAMDSIRNWRNRPTILAIHVKENDSKSALLSLLDANGLKEIDEILCVVVRTAKYNRKSLVNMVNDAVTTRFVLTNVNPDMGMKLGEGVPEVVDRASRQAAKGQVRECTRSEIAPQSNDPPPLLNVTQTTQNVTILGH